jgi:hypothetical protein
MKTKTIITVTLALLLMGVANVPRIAAQEGARQDEAQSTPSESYKLDFTVSELDNGKKINSRSYSTLMRAEAAPKWTGGRSLRAGSRVPVAVGATNANGADDLEIGMNIDYRIMPMANGKVAVWANWQYSTVENALERETGHPVIRHVSPQVDALIPVNKPTIVSEVDDVASTRHYVFEVKVTKVSE